MRFARCACVARRPCSSVPARSRSAILSNRGASAVFQAKAIAACLVGVKEPPLLATGRPGGVPPSQRLGRSPKWSWRA